MGFWTEVVKAWKTAQNEKKFKKQFSKITPIPPALKSEKDAFTAKGEPWVNILRMDVDPDDLSSGMIELDWNDFFIAKLVRAGYKGKDDKDIVNNWFQIICGGIAAEEYEQEIADPEKRRRIQKKQLEDGRTEIS